MKLVVNGDETEAPEGTTISALLEQLSIKSPRVAVEVNQQVVRRDRHAEHELADGDRIEIVTFVGGG